MMGEEEKGAKAEPKVASRRPTKVPYPTGTFVRDEDRTIFLVDNGALRVIYKERTYNILLKQYGVGKFGKTPDGTPGIIVPPPTSITNEERDRYVMGDPCDEPVV